MTICILLHNQSNLFQRCLLPDKVEDEIRQWNRPLKTYHNRRHEDGELEIEVC